jgi:hypothetical protein
VGEAIQSANKCGKNKVMRTSSQPSTIQIMADKTKMENVKYFSYFGSMVSDIRGIREIPSKVSMAKQRSTRRRFLSPLNLR